MSRNSTAVLVLENGKVFYGKSCGARGNTIAEIVFSTGMTGYEESFTDPSYCGQILVTTAPHIGNTGWNAEDVENPAGKIWIKGLVVRDLSRNPSNWRSEGSLESELERQSVPAIEGIDTRALVKVLRNEGSMRGGIFTRESETAEINIDACLKEVQAAPTMAGSSFSEIVSTQQPYTIEPVGKKKATLGILDLGVKFATPRQLALLGVESHILPAHSVYEQFAELKVDGILLPNGPGDPATAHHAVQFAHDVLRREIPLFGICFGNQIIGQALGRSTYKMNFGHRGINIPVKNVHYDRVDITAQNHGFAIAGHPGEVFDTPYGPAELSHYCPNDNTIEGVQLLSQQAMAVQYHPEAAAGPHDSAHVFHQFVDIMTR